LAWEFQNNAVERRMQDEPEYLFPLPGGFGGIGFGLCGLDYASAKIKPRRLKPAPLVRWSKF
jgi:hypothetical protein